LTENLDMVITGLPTSFDGVDELPLCPFRRIVCAAPSYLEQMGEPIHPSDLQNHRCLLYSYVSPARVWTFKSTSTGDIDVAVNGPFHTNDIEAMHCGAVSGLGVAILPRYRAQESLANGSLVEILGLYELPDQGPAAIASQQVSTARQPDRPPGIPGAVHPGEASGVVRAAQSTSGPQQRRSTTFSGG